jgi:hypothetical protein
MQSFPTKYGVGYLLHDLPLSSLHEFESEELQRAKAAMYPSECYGTHEYIDSTYRHSFITKMIQVADAPIRYKNHIQVFYVSKTCQSVHTKSGTESVNPGRLKNQKIQQKFKEKKGSMHHKKNKTIITRKDIAREISAYAVKLHFSGFRY